MIPKGENESPKPIEGYGTVKRTLSRWQSKRIYIAMTVHTTTYEAFAQLTQVKRCTLPQQADTIGGAQPLSRGGTQPFSRRSLSGLGPPGQAESRLPFKNSR